MNKLKYKICNDFKGKFQILKI